MQKELKEKEAFLIKKNAHVITDGQFHLEKFNIDKPINRVQRRAAAKIKRTKK